jgi:hypothetical protein
MCGLDQRKSPGRRRTVCQAVATGAEFVLKPKMQRGLGLGERGDNRANSFGLARRLASTGACLEGHYTQARRKAPARIRKMTISPRLTSSRSIWAEQDN